MLYGLNAAEQGLACAASPPPPVRTHTQAAAKTFFFFLKSHEKTVKPFGRIGGSKPIMRFETLFFIVSLKSLPRLGDISAQAVGKTEGWIHKQETQCKRTGFLFI